MILNLTLLVCLLLAAVWTVVTIRLIHSVIGLAVISVILAIIMGHLNSPLAAVFELSVCAGLIPVIFITTVSFTHRISKEQLHARAKERFMKFWYLPFILVAAGLLLGFFTHAPQLTIPPAGAAENVRNVLWNIRHLDLLGQIIVLLAGAFGVVVFFKESKK